MSSAAHRGLAARLLEERSLDRDQVRRSISAFQNMLGEYMGESEEVTCMAMKALLEDAIDRVVTEDDAALEQLASTYPMSGTESTAMMGTTDDCDIAAPDEATPDEFRIALMAAEDQKPLPRVDIHKDPNIWVCLDEGCNSNCHGEGWAHSTEQKLAKHHSQISDAFTWLHRREREFKGIGNAKVKTTGKRRLCTALKMSNSGLILPGFLESHEEPGDHPLLLSDQSQARLGFVKDMREGKVYLKDHDDYVDIYRAEGSGLKVVCVSHFPPSIDLDLLVPAAKTNLERNRQRENMEVVRTMLGSILPVFE